MQVENYWELPARKVNALQALSKADDNKLSKSPSHQAQGGGFCALRLDVQMELHGPRWSDGSGSWEGGVGDQSGEYW